MQDQTLGATAGEPVSSVVTYDLDTDGAGGNSVPTGRLLPEAVELAFRGFVRRALAPAGLNQAQHRAVKEEILDHWADAWLVAQAAPGHPPAPSEITAAFGSTARISQLLRTQRTRADLRAAFRLPSVVLALIGADVITRCATAALDIARFTERDVARGATGAMAALVWLLTYWVSVCAVRFGVSLANRGIRLGGGVSMSTMGLSIIVFWLSMFLLTVPGASALILGGSLTMDLTMRAHMSSLQGWSLGLFLVTALNEAWRQYSRERE